MRLDSFEAIEPARMDLFNLQQITAEQAQIPHRFAQAVEFGLKPFVCRLKLLMSFSENFDLSGEVRLALGDKVDSALQLFFIHIRFHFLEGTAKVRAFYYSSYLSEMVSGHAGVL